MRIQRILVLLAILVMASTIFAQNALVSFKDATQTTRGYINQEFPGGAYPLGSAGANDSNRWKMVFYKSTDAVINPLVNGLPTGDDAPLMHGTTGLPMVLNVLLGPSGALNISAVVVGASECPVYIYGRLFNAYSVANATKYMTFTAPFLATAGATVSPNIIPTYGWKTDPVWSLINPVTDTWKYNLQFNVPAGDYTINGVGAPYLFTDHDNLEPNLLLGDYTISAAPAGFHWAVNPITVVAGDFALAKTDYVYHATKTFVLVENPPVYPPNTDTPTATPGVFINVDLGANPVAAPTQPAPPAIGNAAGYVHQEVLELLGAGPWTVVYTTMAPYGAWYSYVTGLWTTVPNVGGTITFIIPVGGKSIPEVPIILGDETLPVTFSSFAATLTAQNFVKLTWVTESESNLSGYYVLRSETTDLANAVKLSQLIEATNSSSTQTYSIVDSEVVPQTTYYYWLESVEMNGSSNYHGPTNVYVEAGQPITPSLITTMGNAYPNPFKANSNTNIVYQVKAGETGTITIYNIIGQVVKTVPVSQTNGQVTLKWNGRDSKGNVCGSGIYFYKLSTPSLNITKKMVIVN